MAVSQSIQEKMLEEAYSVTPNYDIDYNDERFTKVEGDREEALTDLELTYAGIIGNADQYYDKQIQASQEWADKQTQLQQDRTDFAIEQINQQKEQAHKDYLKEQSASYVDWQKQSNRYGTAAEQLASAGLTNTGYSESSQVSMYNTYQNRVATAREAFSQATLNYNNAIKDAQLQNNAVLAEIAFEALQKQLELSLAGFQYKNQLILEQANKKIEIDSIYYNRYQDVLEQINHENAVKEDIRQYQETMKWNTEQAEINRQYQAQQAALERQFQQQQALLERQHDKEMLAAETQAAQQKLQKQHELEMAQLAREQQYKMEQLDKQLASEKELLKYKNSLDNIVIDTRGGSSGGSKASSGSSGSGGGSYGYVNTPSNKKTTTTSKSVATNSVNSGGGAGTKKNSNTIMATYDAGGGASKFTGSTYEEAVAYMKKNGVSGAQASGIMTMSEWSRRKSSAGSAASNYSTYKEYLNDTVAYYTAKK